MSKDKILVLVVFVMAIGSTVAFQLINGANGPVKSNGAAAYHPFDFQLRAFAIQVQSGDDSYPYETHIKEIAATGANAVMMSVCGYQENCGSTSIFIDARRCPSPARLKQLIKYAKSLNLKVILMPIILLENPGKDEWRGRIFASNKWADWWEDYTNFITYFADIAQSADVDVLMVGSELLSTETQTEQWVRVIAKVRERYSGRLSYSANWDHYQVAQHGPGWWDKLDLVGMTTYYDLTDGGKNPPTLSNLLAAWKPVRQQVADWQKEIGRPILFTEVGWPNQVTCAHFPWDYYRGEGKPDPMQQRNCFDSFLQSFAREPYVAGYVVWEWSNWTPGEPDYWKTDTSYVPKDKPALEVIEKYMRLPNGSQGGTAASGPGTRESGVETEPATEPATSSATSTAEALPARSTSSVKSAE